MLDWRAGAAVAAGGAIGSVARYAIQTLVPSRGAASIPWATFGINVAGSFCIGFVAAIALREPAIVSPLVRVFLMVGILGGFTTFSGVSLEALTMVRGGALATALAYTSGSIVTGLAAAWFGASLGRGSSVL